MTALERVARAIDPAAWMGGEGPDIDARAARRELALAAARRVFGTIRMSGVRTCGLCDGRPECMCVNASRGRDA